MNLNHLKVFAAVAKAGNITRAAQTLHISQPAVSKQLSELEADLGTQLFDRMPRGVRLTVGGEVLLTHAQRVLLSEQAAESELAELSSLGRGRLSVGASTTIGSYLIPPIFGELNRAHPGLQLALEIANSAAIQSAVLDHQVDLGLTEGLVSSDALEDEVVAKDEMVVIAPPGHPWLRQTGLRAKDLANAAMILREPGSGTRDVVEAELLRRGVIIEPRMSLGGTDAVKNAVASGLGISIVSKLTVELELQTGRLALIPMEDLRIERSLHLLRVKGKTLSAAAHAFVDVLRHRLHPNRPRQRSSTYSI